MTAWGLVTTVRAPEALVRAFVTHHLSLGAAQLWLYFDDPDDPAFDTIAAIPGVVATRCSADYWHAIARQRPTKIENRQTRNAQAAYAACTLPWLGHVDVDEYLWPTRPVADLLADVPPDLVMLRMEPFEAMQDAERPGAPPRLFRGSLKDRHASLRGEILGRYAEILPNAMLSHSVGKAMFRTGITGMSLRLHGAFLNGTRLRGPAFSRDMVLLHCHAQDQSAWGEALEFRLTRGAYQYQPALQAFLAAASPDELDLFWRETQVLTPEKQAQLRGAGRLVEADLLTGPFARAP
jgi:Glycosyl transferase family 2